MLHCTTIVVQCVWIPSIDPRNLEIISLSLQEFRFLVDVALMVVNVCRFATVVAACPFISTCECTCGCVRVCDWVCVCVCVCV